MGAELLEGMDEARELFEQMGFDIVADYYMSKPPAGDFVFMESSLLTQNPN